MRLNSRNRKVRKPSEIPWLRAQSASSPNSAPTTFICVSYFIFISWWQIMNPYSMNTVQWNVHMETLLDQLKVSTCVPEEPPKIPSTPNTRSSKATKLINHPQFISTRQCKNKHGNCQGNDSDFIMDANGGSVVCILCGMIQDTAVLLDAPMYVDSRGGEPTSSRCVVHRYSRIVYLRGLLTSIDGETNVELTNMERRFIKHYITVHSAASGGDCKLLVHQIKRSIRRMKLRPCLVYHAHTIAFQLFGKSQRAQNETEIRRALRRFRALEVAWDRAPKDGPLRQGTKKFPSLPWVWQRICRDLRLSDDTTQLFYVPKTPKQCTTKRERRYIALTHLALR